jgi:hypothetical protein
VAPAKSKTRPTDSPESPAPTGWPADKVERRPLASLIAYARNARLHSDEQVAQIAASILQWGWTMPVLIDEGGEIIAGHGRALAAAKLGLIDIPVMVAVGWTDEQKRAYVIADNKLTLNAAWDDTLLKLELSDLREAGFDLGLTGFSTDELQVLWHGAPPSTAGNLAERFGIPPFTVLNAREGWWQDRKAAWLRLGIMSELGRGDALTWDDNDEGDIDGFRHNKAMHRKANAIPGGSRMPGVDPATGKIVRTDSRARPITTGAVPGGSAKTISASSRDLYKVKTADGYRTPAEAARLNTHGDPIKPGVTPAGLVYGEINSYDGAQRTISGTSIFDPVLCELAYRWFCPPGGTVLDPFAGGSVRGIVAAKLGRHYVGIDLSERQLEANRAQARAIIGSEPPPNMVKISAKMARLPFNGCDPEYIRTTCHAACCQSSTSESGTMITIHPSEQARIEARGGVVIDGFLEPIKRRCPFKSSTTHLCGLHATPDKPFGCIASPFTLNNKRTLIVRNRYRLLLCFDHGKKIPAYQAFRASLDLIFGEPEAARITEHLDNGGGDLLAPISDHAIRMLTDNDAIKHGELSAGAPEAGAPFDLPMPCWLAGDSRHIHELAQGTNADFVFSCPPYADLERYSDDPRDLSTFGYEAFRKALAEIIAKTCAYLKPDRFACFVVGDVRDKAGNYYGFPSHVIEAFQAAGLALYNEAILVTAVGSLPIRAAKQFATSRKLGKTHQNVLVFVKGDARIAAQAIGETEFGEITDEAQYARTETDADASAAAARQSIEAAADR